MFPLNKILLVILFSTLFNNLFAQNPTSNNTCENATWLEIQSGDDINPVYIDHAFNTLNRTPDCFIPYGDGLFVDSYYKFVVPPSGHIRFDNFSSYGISIFENCNGETLFCGAHSHWWGDIYVPFNYSYIDAINLTPDDTLLLQIFQAETDFGYNYYSESLSLYLYASEIGTAPNNNCQNPIWIDLKPGGAYTSFNINHSTNTLFTKPDCINFEPMADSYFNLVVPPSGKMRFTILGDDYDTNFGIGIFDKCDGELLDCGYKPPIFHWSEEPYYSLDTEALNAGDTILLQVFQTSPKGLGELGANFESVEFALSVKEIADQLNNYSCNNAELIDMGSLPFNPINNTLTIDPSCATKPMDADIFYKFVVPSTGAVRLARTISHNNYFSYYYNFDYVNSFGGISIYDNCNNEPIYCINNENFYYGNNEYNQTYVSTSFTDLSQNDTLILQFFSEKYNINYRIDFETIQPDLNNTCDEALDIDFGKTYSFSLKENTNDLLPNCYEAENIGFYGNINPKPFADIFYRLTVPEIGGLRFDISSTVGVALYDACNGNNLYCNNAVDQDQIIEGLEPGQKIIIQFYDEWGTPANVDFSINKHNSNTNCHLNDWLALKALYESTNGHNWINNTEWDQVSGVERFANCDLSLLYGVSLNEAGRVYCIDLDGNHNCTNDALSPGNNLTGFLPDLKDSYLNELTTLCLNYNKISGPLSEDIAKFYNLKFLWLHGNQFSGEIPNKIFSDLKNLEILYLSDNQFSGLIPNSIKESENLVELGLFQNQLSGRVPTGITNNLIDLQILNLRNNQLTGSFPFLFNQRSLKRLYLSSNQFSGEIPYSYSSLWNLTELFVFDNQLEGCFDVQLIDLCDQLTKPNASERIDIGNNFNAKWEDFCSCNAGNCELEGNILVINNNSPLPNLSQYNGNIETEGSVGIYPGEDITFAAQNVFLNSGFEVSKKATFTALYDPCENQTAFQKSHE